VSKLLCTCGHTIVDQTDYLPYKASFFLDQDQDIRMVRLVETIVDFMKAWREGKEEDVVGMSLSELYGSGSELKGFISQTIGAFEAVFSHEMFECEKCGRLWVQPDERTNEFLPYLPEEETRGILQSKRVQTKDAKMDCT
jgi:hypothetical protein